MKNSQIILLAFILLLGACNTASDKADFDRAPILKNISENLIIPAYKRAQTEASELNSLITAFQEDPTEEDLQQMRLQWKKLSSSWAAAEVFNFGPIENSFIENRIHYWPVDTARVETAIAAYERQEQYLETVGSNKKGIAAIEYILFSDSAASSLEKLKDANRIAILALLSEDLQNNLSIVIEQWNNGYQQQFVENTGNSASSSLTLLANEMIFLLEKVKNQKLAAPMGITEMSEADPQLVEAPYSNYSLSLIKENIQAIKAAFNGGDGKGLDDYLDALDIKNEEDKLLSQKINEQFNKVLVAANKIDTTLSQAISSKSPALEELYLQIINLTIILKNDMMSQLGLVVVFSDNDGD